VTQAESIARGSVERRSAPKTLRRDLDACTGDGATYALMVGVGETYLAAFVVALGMSGVTAGLVASAPPVAGGVLQLLAPRCVRAIGSPRRWIMVCASVQAMSLLVLAIGALTGGMPAWGIFACASVYWTGALGAGGAWNTWVAELFPARLRARYFGQRNRFCQLMILTGLLVGGALIGFGERHGATLVAFAACFGIAGASRLLSLAYLARTSDIPVGDSHTIVPLRRLFFAGDNASKIIVAMLCLQAAVQVGQPFFNPFMLKALDFAPMTYTAAIAASFVAKVIALPIAAKLADRHGAHQVLVGSAIGIAFLALVWLVSGSAWWIVPSQLVAGALWGAYELATFLILLETVPHRERTSVMSWFYLVNAASMTIGSLLGARILSGEETWNGYATVFAASTLLRLLAVVPFLSLRTIGRVHRDLIVETIAVRASAGSIDLPQEIAPDSACDAGDSPR